MGGFGALNIAMHHPEVFSAVYSMSPGLFDENGLAELQIFESEALIRKFIKYENELSAVPLEEAERKCSRRRNGSRYLMVLHLLQTQTGFRLFLIIPLQKLMVSWCAMMQFGKNGRAAMAVLPMKHRNTRITF